EVEAAVKSHPDVFDCTVVGAPDPRWGERVVAVIELRPGKSPSLEQIQEHCRQKIAGYKIPRLLHVVDKVVRSPSGKPDYRWAKKQVTESPGHAGGGVHVRAQSRIAQLHRRRAHRC